MSHDSSFRLLARAVKRAPERALHARRRAKARARMAALAPRSVLFLCHGNICRSPYAAQAVRDRWRELGIAVDSAGFVQPDRRSPPEAVEAARLRGVDLGRHRSKLVTTDLARANDLVVVMDPGQARATREAGCPEDRILVLGDLDPDPIDTRRIVDPNEKPPEVFADSYARIDRCLAELSSLIARPAP